MSRNRKAPPENLCAPELTDAVNAIQDEARPLDAPAGPVEIAEAIPEEIQSAGEVFRQSAELTLEQSRASYERMRKAAEEATANMEAAIAAARSGVAELNVKAFEVMRASTDANLDFVRAVAGARTMSDVVTLQGEHMRSQFETMSTQIREFVELASKLSARALAPLNETVGKAVGGPA